MRVAVERRVNPKHLRRASKIDSALIAPYMEQLTQEISKTIDYWRTGDLSADHVDVAIDALLALWTEVGARGMR